MMAVKHFIGAETVYRGTEIGPLQELPVRVVALLRGGVDRDADGARLDDDDSIRASGGIKFGDRVEVRPFLYEECRFARVTCDPRVEDLALFEEPECPSCGTISLLGERSCNCPPEEAPPEGCTCEELGEHVGGLFVDFDGTPAELLCPACHRALEEEP